jgi:hypothetical protein
MADWDEPATSPPGAKRADAQVSAPPGTVDFGHAGGLTPVVADCEGHATPGLRGRRFRADFSFEECFAVHTLSRKPVFERCS